MASANPPIAVLRNSPFDSEQYKRNLEDILNQLWVRTGGSTDTVTNITVQEQFAWNLSSEIQKKYNAVSTSTDYTAVPFDFVNATSASTITLPQYPEGNDVVIIRNGDGTQISIAGNGKNINGESAGSIARKGTALVIHYFIDEDEWFVR